MIAALLIFPLILRMLVMFWGQTDYPDYFDIFLYMCMYKYICMYICVYILYTYMHVYTDMQQNMFVCISLRHDILLETRDLIFIKLDLCNCIKKHSTYNRI